MSYGCTIFIQFYCVGLQAAFPPNKQQEAIIFCQEEILLYISDNLFVQTPQTLLANNKMLAAEDAEARYQRILISSLHGYSLYLNKVPPEDVTKALDLNLKIVSNAKFWKIPKQSDPSVKAAWFGIITALCQKSPALVEKEKSHIVGAVFGNIDDREPTVALYVWEAVLSVLSKVKVCIIPLVFE